LLKASGNLTATRKRAIIATGSFSLSVAKRFWPMVVKP
jgi:hypothetical protein